MVYLYILRSTKDGSYYVGHTKNLRGRLYRHNSAQSISTKSRAPWKIVYIEKFNNRIEAVKRERQIKKEKSKNFINRLIRRGVAQFGLARNVWDVEVVGSNPSSPTKFDKMSGRSQVQILSPRPNITLLNCACSSAG